MKSVSREEEKKKKKSRLHVLAEVAERADQTAAQQVLVHLRLLQDQAVGRLAAHGQRVVGLVALLGAGAQDSQQLGQRHAGFRRRRWRRRRWRRRGRRRWRRRGE